jgi:plasmid stabilization system protein ParE
VTWRPIVEAQAEAEITEVAAWYGTRRVVARDAFLVSVSAALNALEINPLQYQIIRGTVRRVLVRGFPYALLYSVADNDVVVTVCIHTSRDPERWHRRFPL